MIGAKFACIPNRNGDAIIAKGDVQIEAGDKVVIFALPSAVKKVIKLFQK